MEVFTKHTVLNHVFRAQVNVLYSALDKKINK